MRACGVIGALCASLMLAACGADAPQEDPAAVAEVELPSYPPTRIAEQVDEIHGVEVRDPYRWLEADVRQDEEVRAWVDAQQAHADAYLKALPDWQALNTELTDVWNAERFGVPARHGALYFYSRNDGLMNQSQVLVEDAEGASRVLFDPNTWSADGTVALASYYPDPAGEKVVYLVQDAGSDWRTARIRDVATGEDLDDELNWLKFSSVAWLPDGSGFYYTRFPEPDKDLYHARPEDHAVYFHKLGDAQSADTLVHHVREEPNWRYFVDVTEDGAYLIIGVAKGTDRKYQILVKDLAGDEDPQYLVKGFIADFTPIGHAGGELFFRSTLEAPLGRVVALNPALGEKAVDAARVVVPENDETLLSASLLGGKLVARYLVDANSRIDVYGLDGKSLGNVPLPGLGTAGGFSGWSDSTEAFFAYSSINYPPAVLRLDLETLETTEFKRSKFNVNPDDYVVKQVFYTSKDGTRVPMFISHRKDLELDGKRPTLLYGYGGFNISLTPTFSISRIVWMQRGGVSAIANLRGGGEYGEAWHQAGTRLNKQNVFDDFIAAGEYLVAEGYTAPRHLGIMGGSNGGLLVGAVINQRPDLFGAALPLVGVMDMVRFHLFTAGRAWTDDYGSAEDAAEFEALYAYSPYHNITAQAYPPVLVGTADTDDRVVPGHSFKYAARLQAMSTGSAPALLRVESRAGHGSGKPTEKAIEEYTDYWAFLLHHLN